MSITVKKPQNDEIRIGEYAATQPLSGTRIVVQQPFIKGSGHIGYGQAEEPARKKASA